MFSKFFLLALLTACCCFHDVWSQRQKGYYTIVAPGTIRQAFPYQVSISLSDFHQSCWFNISIEGQYNQILTTVEVEPGTTKLVEIRAPRMIYGEALLIVNGWRGIISRDIGQLNVEESPFMVFIQTSKPKYRPGELVQFRVVFIDRLTLPARLFGAIQVMIYDGDKNLIKKVSNVQLKQGVFKDELKLSEYTVLGDWKIEVVSEGLKLEDKSFEVAKYKLPMFSVIIISKKDVSLSEGHLELNIEARYTYGEPVKGNLTLSIHSIYSAYEEPKKHSVKEMAINGNITVQFDFDTDLNITKNINETRLLRLFTFNIEAVVKDSITSQTSQSTTEIVVHSHPFRIDIKAPTFFEHNKPTNITVSVMDFENKPIYDAFNNVTVSLEARPFKTSERMMIHYEKLASIYGRPTKNITTQRLDKNGTVRLSLNLTSPRMVEYTVFAEYLRCRTLTETLVKNSDNFFVLEVLTNRPEVGKDLIIRLQSLDPIHHFVYNIITRGNIIQTERISVPNEETVYLLHVNVTYSMVPKITLYVNRVQNNTFDGRLKDIYIKRAFRNSIRINTDHEVRPGSEVNINITTDKGSYVGLMGIDHKLLSETIANNDLSEDNIFTKLRSFDSINMNTVRYPGIEAGLITFSNSFNRAGFSIGKLRISYIVGGTAYPIPEPVEMPTIELPRIRKLFSESWMFENFERTASEVQTRQTVPDTITTWAITGFSLNPESGLALTKNATRLKVFQPFFISLDLPTSIKEGEILAIPVYVFNHFSEDLLVNVTIEQRVNDLQFFESLNSEADIKVERTTSISANGSAKFFFLCRPHMPGRHNITAKAIATTTSDAIQKTLVVEARGIPHSVSKTHMFHLPQNAEQESEISLNTPEKIIQGSESVHISVIGDICGRLTERLEELIRVPFGNGEESMTYTVSSLLVLKYLKTLKYSNPSLENRAKLYLELGYQTQLTFKHIDGSFGLFDRHLGRTGDVGLTAFVIWGLQHASLYIHVDPHVLQRGLDYLKLKQNDAGGFNSGRGTNEDVKLTALTLLAFLVDDKRRYKYQDVISKGLVYLYKAQDHLEHTTPALLSAYTLTMAKHEQSQELLAKLSGHVSLKEKQTSRRTTETLQSNVEKTAGDFLNLLNSQNRSDQNLLQIVRALVLESQDERSPDHMIALEAMINFARDIDLASKNLDIRFSDDQGGSGSFHVDSENAQVMQVLELNPSTRKVYVQANGTGYAVVEIRHRFNLEPDYKSSSNFKANLTIKNTIESLTIFEACVAIRSLGLQGNLTGMEVSLQSGYLIDENVLHDIPMSNDQVKAIKVKGHGNSVLFHLENISRDGICIQFEAVRAFSVYNAFPSNTAVYDVQRMDQKAIYYFHMEPVESSNPFTN